MSNTVKYKRTSVKDKKITKDILSYGELALNYNTSSPMIMIKDSQDNIVSFISESKIESGFTEVSDNLDKVNNEITNNKTNVETVQTWVNSPATEDEVRALFSK